MSEYRNFNRCIICRSKYILEEYKGEFEITMLLNILYMTVMRTLEKRDNLDIKSKKIQNWLDDKGIVNRCNNEFDSDEIIRYLRNGLAHFNISISKDMLNVKIGAKNFKKVKKCENCGNIINMANNFNEISGYICVFNFSIEQLAEFTNFMIDEVLNILPNDVCKECIYRKV